MIGTERWRQTGKETNLLTLRHFILYLQMWRSLFQIIQPLEYSSINETKLPQEYAQTLMILKSGI